MGKSYDLKYIEGQIDYYKDEVTYYKNEIATYQRKIEDMKLALIVCQETLDDWEAEMKKLTRTPKVGEVWLFGAGGSPRLIIHNQSGELCAVDFNGRHANTVKDNFNKCNYVFAANSLDEYYQNKK